MPLALLCDEHIDYDIIVGLVGQGIDAVSAQQIGLAATDDALILAEARRLGRVIYTGDDDYLLLNSSGILHPGIFYHHPLKYSIGQAIDAVATACQVLSAEEMANRVEFL
ncbi:MAG: hypothetical protein F4X65_02795 [Chloroflexi bacterium]|nr:hypothetical protein [Chloroflexota bacterium]